MSLPFQLYTTAQAAQILGLSVASVRRRIRNGQLAALRLGDGDGAPLRIAHEELERYAYSRPVRGSLGLERRVRLLDASEQ